MKRFLMATIAVFMMAGAAVAAENTVVAESKSVAVVSDNVAGKLAALIKEYTQKVKAADSVEALEQVYTALESAMTEFGEKYEAEIIAFDAKPAEERAKDEEAVKQAMADFEKALESKAAQFME